MYSCHPMSSITTKPEPLPDTWLEDDLLDSIDPFSDTPVPELPDSGSHHDVDFITPEAVQVKVEVDVTCPYCFLQFPDQLSLEEHVELCPKSIQDETCEEVKQDEDEDPISIEPIVTSSTTSTNSVPEVKKLPALVPPRKFTCTICSAKFRYSHHLTRHAKVHSFSSERPHRCNYCHANFVSSYQLTRHKLIHGASAISTNQRIISVESRKKIQITPGKEVTERKVQFCEICLTAFSCRRNYDIHKKIHLGQKPYKCGECAASYKSKEELMTHMRKHLHSATSSTNSSTPAIPKLPPGISISPISKVVPKKVTRPIPGSIPISFLTPSRTNGNKAVTCNLPKPKTTPSKPVPAAPSNSTVKKRVRKNGKGKFECDVCGHIFVRGHHLTRHKLIHTGERPHKCSQCHKSYSRKEHLTAHLRTHEGQDTQKQQEHWMRLENQPIVELGDDQEELPEIVGI